MSQWFYARGIHFFESWLVFGVVGREADESCEMPARGASGRDDEVGITPEIMDLVAYPANRMLHVDQMIGKGGLVTEKMLSHDLANRLEARRLDSPENVRDRGINYTRYYDIAGGKKWSEAFSRASNEALSFSLGGHSARHFFAQQRESELQSRGYSIKEARGIVSQELGHFSPNTTRCYER